MTRFTSRCAVYLFLERNDKILLMRRYNTGYMDGMYSLISGHVEKGESIETAIVREAKEEAGITISEYALVPVHAMHRKSTDDLVYADFYFKANFWLNEPVIGEPELCDALDWFDRRSLPKNIIPYIRHVLKQIDKKIPFSVYGWG